MFALLADKRFSLFAPFIALAGLALIAFVFWVLIAGRITDALSDNGLSWQGLAREGFPARISLYLDAPQWRDGDFSWQNDAMSLTVMPFNRAHAIVDFSGDHQLATKDGQFNLAHQGNLMSLVVDDDRLSRASFEAKKADVSARFGGIEWRAQAAVLELHMRRNAARSDIALVTKQLRINTNEQSDRLGAELGLARLDASVSVPEGALNRGLSAGDVVALERLTLERGALTLIAKGRVKLRANGTVDGALDLDIVNLNAFADALIDVGLISRRDRQILLLLGGLGAALGGDTQDRLSLPLRFQDRRIFLGGLDLGAAPKWR